LTSFILFNLIIAPNKLIKGARCEANTFDGERCMYAALTDHIRSVLKNYKVNTSKLDQYELFLERLFYFKLLNALRVRFICFILFFLFFYFKFNIFIIKRLLELGLHSDIVFSIKGAQFKAHKCILAARSSYFKQKFENKWKNRTFILGTHEEVNIS
jgi:ankyrin repeat and BTB/POZ domain-containing protein 1